jgi:hypothetical protein
MLNTCPRKYAALDLLVYTTPHHTSDKIQMSSIKAATREHSDKKEKGGGLIERKY